jgi:glycosyltransferase involved in cell wall biosynthesis
MNKGFADNYLLKYRGDIFIVPERYLYFDIAVVIPCYDEPEIAETLNSLIRCHTDGIIVSVIVVVNSTVDSALQVIEQNRKTFQELELLTTQFINRIQFHVLHVEKLPAKHGGVGWARKIGMDWAVSQFNYMGKSDGVIISLDADAIVENNYFQTIWSYFKKNGEAVGATIYFEHQSLRQNQHYDQQGIAIVMYELYMRYYRHALLMAEFPNSIYTVGSCFAVKVDAYIAQGGMNRRKAGEDFYFLHKLAMFGFVGEINSTTIYPSARISGRVPFGTGTVIRKYVEGDMSLELTYSLQSFQLLKAFFNNIDNYYLAGNKLSVNDFTDNETFGAFLHVNNFASQVIQLVGNCSSLFVFKKRFFHLFNAFMVLKWLNFSVSNSFPRKSLIVECGNLLTLMGFDRMNIPDDPKLMLNLFRQIDRERTNH